MFSSLLTLSFMLGFELNKVFAYPNSETNAYPNFYHQLPPIMQTPNHQLPPIMQSPNFRKIGFLTSREMSDHVIMPLFGEPAPYRRQRYNYYTVNDTHNALSIVKLPLYHRDRDCTDEVACDEIYSGDLIRVHGYEAPFVAEVY